MSKYILICLSAMLLMQNAHAGKMYIWEDSEGVKHYSDRPPGDTDRKQIKGEVKTGELKVDTSPVVVVPDEPENEPVKQVGQEADEAESQPQAGESQDDEKASGTQKVGSKER